MQQQSMPHPFSDLAQPPALCCSGPEIDFTGILYHQNMPPRTNRICAIASSFLQPVYRDTRVGQKLAEAGNVATVSTCHLPQTGTFTADYTFKEVRATSI